MHESVMTWVGRQVNDEGIGSLDTLEVGSLNVNGSVREFFTGAYVGLDMRDGPGVDVVGTADSLPFPSESFDNVVCTEMFEHDPYFWKSLAEIGRVLRPLGHLIITTRGNGFGEHNEPSDYFRFMPASRVVLLDLASCDPIQLDLDPEVPGIFAHGVRRP